MLSPKIKTIIYRTFVLSTFFLTLILLFDKSAKSDWHDFDVFYNAASSVLVGKSIYAIIGKYNLPFWYLPWTAWFFIPYAIWPRNGGLLLYQATSLFSGVFIVNFLINYYKPNSNFLDKLFILTSICLMSFQLIFVGQMDFILLGLLVSVMWAVESKNDFLVGLLFPILLTKPHLIIPFTFFLFWRERKRALILSSSLLFGMLLIETILRPGWYLEMIHLLQDSGQRIDGLPFTTFSSMLGWQENWVGTANMPFSLILIFVAIIILWKFRRLAPMPFFSLALTASLFCAPRAYAYNLPMLIPAMIWISANELESTRWIWVIAALFPLLTGFSSSTYLITLLIFLLGIRKATKEINSA